MVIQLGKNRTLKKLKESLLSFEYEKVCSLLKPGQFSCIGGNVLIYPVNKLDPISIEYFGDEIDNIYSFNIETGKKIESIKNIELLQNFIVLSKGEKIIPDSFVVHKDHGIGKLSHLMTKKVSGEDIIYVVLNYLNEDKLFVPIELIEKISSYIGVGRRSPRLNKLGSETWKRTYKKTYENIILLARELLNVYAKREIASRKPWQINDEWNGEVIKTFGYRDTADQKNAIKDVFSDLQKDIPMDRLICGDVGFGKTEVAIRAAVQAVYNNFQVAILVPTTILAEQHFVTLQKRLEKLPIKIAHISRLVKKQDQNKILEGLKDGTVDIVVSTHKIFHQSMNISKLGLLVIDEEQKFGVRDKEKLKKLKTALNVLALTATPIPRTLFMALSGIRDLSQINIAPAGRKKIMTEIEKHNIEKIKKYIDREIKRKGQVYYLHNEVSTIGGVKNKLSKIYPQLKIEVAHGQMGEIELSRTMRVFAEGGIDILVCSTIIENGLDISNVNTLIVEDADKFGLSSLYQIRGRIGRSPKQSYALFTYKNKTITNNAHKRLKALLENQELGSGYGIALSDLEIRGGGNILGREQHGNMEAIGLVLYTKLLNQAVGRLKHNS
jgi:transcription-repair coupling factor (superfamily II helicase)